MDLFEAKLEVKQLLSRVKSRDLSRLLQWVRESDDLDELLSDNRRKILQNISEDLRGSLPQSAMLPSESTALSKTLTSYKCASLLDGAHVWAGEEGAEGGVVRSVFCDFLTVLNALSDFQLRALLKRRAAMETKQWMQQSSKPTVHVDSFLYDEEEVDSLCDEGSLSRSYCLSCGSTRTAPLDFLSHSFSIPELHFLFESVLPDLSGRVLVDVGSRLGAVLYGGYVFSSASRLVGLEISEEFVKLQENIVQKYTMTDRIQVLHSDVRLQNVLLQNADVLVLNNVFEYFLPLEEQIGAWSFIMENFRKKGSLLVTVPCLQESLDTLQMLLPPCWVEELPLDYDVYLGKDTDPDALRQIHLYRVL